MVHQWLSFRDTEGILNINNCLGHSKKDRKKDREEGSQCRHTVKEVAAKGRRDLG